MILTIGPSFEFIRFFQIVGWILLPVLLLVILLTIYLHYRQQQQKRLVAEDAENALLIAAPERFHHHVRDGEYVYFDHSGLIREYKARLFYNHARYAALRNDYAVLEAKFASLAATPDVSFFKTKNNRMKTMEAPVITAIAELAVDTIDKQELAGQLEQLNRSYRRLEEENRFLQEQLSIQTADDSGREKIIHRWQEEHRLLHDKLAGQDYLQALLEEKKSQVDFLQTQLEQRIKNQYQADQQRKQAIAELEELRVRQEEEKEQWQAQLAAKEEQVACLEGVVQKIRELVAASC